MTDTKQAPRGIEIRELLIRVSRDNLPGFKHSHRDYTYEEIEPRSDDHWFRSTDRELITKVCRDYWEFETPHSISTTSKSWSKSRGVDYILETQRVVELYKDDADFTDEMLAVWDWEQDFSSYLIARDGTLRHPDYFWLCPPYDQATQAQALLMMSYSHPLKGKRLITADTAVGRRWIKARRKAVG